MHGCAGAAVLQRVRRGCAALRVVGSPPAAGVVVDDGPCDLPPLADAGAVADEEPSTCTRAGWLNAFLLLLQQQQQQQQQPSCRNRTCCSSSSQWGR
jgi:hypothetical protein